MLLHPTMLHLTDIITPLVFLNYSEKSFLCTAPLYFLKVMLIILRGFHDLKPLIDDIIVVASNKAEHNKRLKKLCKQLQDY